MVVERYRCVRDMLRIAIHPMPGLEVVAEAGDATEAAGLAMEHEPDVILLDVDWPSLAGFGAVPLLRLAVPQALIVMYSSEPDFEHPDPEDAAATAIAAGADAYLTAASTLEEMVTLLQAAPACPRYERDLLEELVV
jgi:DNA-binding NarL/FixJ family response regulator